MVCIWMGLHTLHLTLGFAVSGSSRRDAIDVLSMGVPSSEISALTTVAADVLMPEVYLLNFMLPQVNILILAFVK